MILDELQPDLHYTKTKLSDGASLAHYAGAKTIEKILEKGQLWLRRTDSMNDHREVKHGFEILMNMLQRHDIHEAFQRSIDACCPSLGREVLDELSGWLPFLQPHTHIICVTEHCTKGSLRDGRLSMWRAYGGDETVALVLNTKVLNETRFDLFRFRKVRYADQSTAETLLLELFDRVEVDAKLFAPYCRDEIKRYFNTQFADFVLCTKHPGFEEEQEWRLMTNTRETKIRGLLDWVVVRNQDELVVKLTIADALPTRALKDWVKTMIVGPSPRQRDVERNLKDFITSKNMDFPLEHISCSEIPYRPMN